MKIEKVRIAFFIDGNEGGGVVEYLFLLLKNIDRNYFYCSGVFIGKGKSYTRLKNFFDENKILTTGNLINYKNDKIKIVQNLIKLWITMVTIFKFWKYTKTKKIQIIDANYFPHHLIAGIVARLSNIKCVWHWHGAQKRSLMRNIFISLSAKFFSDTVICISIFVQKSLPKYALDKSVVIYNGVEIQDYQKANKYSLHKLLNISSETKLIGIIGTLNPLKGHEYFILAADIILKKYSNIKFLIIGEETTAHKKRFQYKGKLINEIANLKRENDIIFTGNIQGFKSYMSDLYLVVMPTIPIGVTLGEGFGLVVAEAMAQGVPAIASTTGAFPEIVSTDIEGILVEPKDAKGIAFAIEKLFDKNNYEFMSRASKEKVSNNFNIKKKIKELEFIYYNLSKEIA